MANDETVIKFARATVITISMPHDQSKITVKLRKSGQRVLDAMRQLATSVSAETEVSDVGDHYKALTVTSALPDVFRSWYDADYLMCPISPQPRAEMASILLPNLTQYHS